MPGCLNAMVQCAAAGQAAAHGTDMSFRAARRLPEALHVANRAGEVPFL